MVVFSFAVFFKPLSQEFHSGRAGISLAFTLHNLMAAVSVPLLAGRLVDRYGARKVILPYTVMFALMLLSSKILSGKMWELYALTRRWVWPAAVCPWFRMVAWSRSGSTDAEGWLLD
jgi:MFS family permease